jgi:hypothetical protein
LAGVGVVVEQPLAIISSPITSATWIRMRFQLPGGFSPDVYTSGQNVATGRLRPRLAGGRPACEPPARRTRHDRNKPIDGLFLVAIVRFRAQA